MTVGYAKDTVKIPVYTGDGQYDRTRYGINYPYLFPGKEIEDKVPTVQIGQLTNPIDGGPYPSSSAGPIYTFSDTLTHVRSRHTFKVGAYVEYSGEDDFDQINVQANLPGDTNNQNGRFEFNDGRAGGTGTASRTPPSACSRTTPRSASAPTPSTGPGRSTSSPRTPGR